MQFINKEDDSPSGVLNFAEHCLQTLFKLAAELGAGNQGPHIKRHHPLVFQALWHISLNDTHRQALRNCGFTNPRFADKHWIVFRSSREHLNHTADFFVATDHRV